MKYVAVVLSVVLAIGYFASYGGSHNSDRKCLAGVAKAYATLQHDPGYLVGTIPGKYVGDPTFFTVRYNCRGGSIHIRRADLGTYDVRFPGLRVHTAIVTVISDEGGFASIGAINHNEFRVTIRGPLSQGNVNLRRDLPFSIVVY